MEKTKPKGIEQRSAKKHMIYAQAIGLGTQAILILTAGLAFLLSLRTGRILPAVLVCWIGLTCQVLVLAQAGAYLAMSSDELCWLFPEATLIIPYAMFGWFFGLPIGGMGKWIYIIKEKRQNKQIQNIGTNAPNSDL